ncbi:MAG TPA: M14 family metallopeptidase [Chthonomonas sp.]|uniref:M14 family metallopeptidase n=1 Tax=Chthonomonas sp. TaxID=2282153 RepID=UPI002B4B9609|nr:M14 family metallopeptidase [Chthonomonas sp.]HLI49562.1 M14 family metallopeptidase [Chthonomonas sp.]
MAKQDAGDFVWIWNMQLTDIRFDTYYPYAALTECLQALVEAFPHLLRLESIGKSYEGRDVWLVTATRFDTGPDTEKPAYWCDGNIHATEVSASSACLYILHYLATHYGSDPHVTRALDSRAFYVVPRVNPDGAELYFSDKPRFLRSSVRPYPYDEEPIEGLRIEDVDGDGRILNMRIPDPNGPWKIHPEHPRLMVRREPTETGGTYYRILPEGILENWDGFTLTLQRNKEGLDLNRNFPAHWRQEHQQRGAGPFPGSEPEVHNLLQFITSHPNITGGLTFHTYGGVLLRPYGTQADDTMPAEDLWVFQTIGQKGAELTGYPHVSVYHDFRYHPNEVITGVWDDWMYDHLGLFAWTVEIWSPQRQAGITEGFSPDTKSGQYRFIQWYRDHPLEEDIKMLEWSDANLGGRGYVAWRPFQHPQLGAVEIGGWDVQYAFRNPPPQFLEKEIAPFARWVLWNALLSPLLQVHSATAEPLGEGAYCVRLVVDNVGWLPTYISKKALEKQVCRPLVAEIELPEGAVLEVGKPRMEGEQLEGKAYKASAPYGWTADATRERAKVEWVVRGPAGSVVKLTARHDRAGVVRAQVTLPDF